MTPVDLAFNSIRFELQWGFPRYLIQAIDLLFGNKEGYTPLIYLSNMKVVMFILDMLNITADYGNPDISIPLHCCCLHAKTYC